MTKKVYLKTVKDINAYVKPGTRLYIDEGHPSPKTDDYIQFVDGVLCLFYNDGKLRVYNVGIHLDLHDYYILAEEPVQFATKDDVGKLCIFAQSRDYLSLGSVGIVGRLFEVQEGGWFLREGDTEPYCCCRVLAPEEVSNITGYALITGYAVVGDE